MQSVMRTSTLLVRVLLMYNINNYSHTILNLHVSMFIFNFQF